MPDTSKFITFVLGAGSSFEVGMPTGADLKDKIAESVRFEASVFGEISGGDRQIWTAMQTLATGPRNSHTLNDYFQAARRIADGAPQAPSIDNFIDSNRSNPVIASVGKLAIANAILKAEQSGALYIDPHNAYNKINFSDLSNTWFLAFFQLICMNAQEEDLPDRFRKVRVVTFNYDRTLEHYLFHSIQNYYGCNGDRAKEILAHLEVYHPYGKVGNLPWQEAGPVVDYGGQVTISDLITVAATLKTFTEGTSVRESEIEEIRESIIGADTLVFLGFAFHELNLKLLFDFNQNNYVQRPRQVFGTAFRISESNAASIKSTLAHLIGLDSSCVVLRSDLTAAELLPEYSWVLTMPDSD
jgi:hypothetical protein